MGGVLRSGRRLLSRREGYWLVAWLVERLGLGQKCSMFLGFVVVIGAGGDNTYGLPADDGDERQERVIVGGDDAASREDCLGEVNSAASSVMSCWLEPALNSWMSYARGSFAPARG